MGGHIVTRALEGGSPTELIGRRFENLIVSYRLECAQGIPMSVRERYERRLEELRARLRTRKPSCSFGEVLRRLGAVDSRCVADALRIQREDRVERLLGEILVDLGWINEAMLRRAVQRQEEEHERCLNPLESESVNSG